jgi:hypothetical protein
MRTTMNRPASTTSFAPGPLLLAALIFVAALTRLLPHPPNFSPVEAIALFGGAYFASRKWALLVPLAALLLSDLALGAIRGGTYLQYFTSADYLPSLLAIYACVALCSVLGFGLRGRVDGTRVLGYSLAGSIVFFALSNFATWLTALAIPGYPACSAGLGACYVAGIPFFQWTVLGTLFYSALLFGGFALLRRKLPALRAQTV